jgi:hypothetical protein
MFAKVKVTAVAMLALAGLAACGSGEQTAVNPVTSTTPAGSNAYPSNAPPPATSDVQAFKLNVWDNLQGDDRCGSCHKPSQTPRFVRADDINIAYQEANTVVDLASPGLSRLVTKVRGGHHCWLADNNACGDTITRWITAWASVTQGGGGTTIQLVPPVLADPGPSRIFPTDASTGGANSFANTVWPVLTANCAQCHRADAATPQQPYFASPDANVSYEQARTKMNLDAPALSRLVLRLRNEFHNCWRIPSNGSVDCTQSANVMETAITNFAAGIPSTPIPSAWVTSKALGLYGGTVASGGNRYDQNVIALYEFKTGNGATAYDTSGVQPALDLTLATTSAGGYQWVGGWGVQFTGGKAQGLTSVSRKLQTMIGQTGEYTIEAWAAPANVTQEESRIVSYSGGVQTRNFTMGQTLYNYDFMARTAGTGAEIANGQPQLSTPDADDVLQATLQHVAMTFSPVDGRRIYVNGELVATRAGGVGLGSWDDTLAFVLGNEASGDRPWLGTLKLVAVHNRAMTQPQVQQNFEAGVGEKYFLLFSVSDIVNIPQSYIMFEVSQYDSYAYLFNHPKFISLDQTAAPNNIVVKGMRIGVNGTEPMVGQAYRTLDTAVTSQNYTAVAGASLSNVGTIIGLERGPQADEFFLTFEQLGSAMNVRVEASPQTPPAPPSVARPSDVGVRTFDGINETFSQITGVQLAGTAGAAGRMRTTFQGLKQALPPVENFSSFLASHQIAVAQLAIAFCSEMVDDPALRSAFFPGANFSSTLSSQADRDLFINPTIAKVLGANLATQPDPVTMHGELDALISNSTAGRAQGLCISNSCGGSRTTVVAKAVCASGLASAATLIQ